MPPRTTEPRVIVALDFADLGPARELVRRLDPTLCRLKVGKEMYTRYGPHFVEELIKAGYEVFLDLKFHDIPNTVAAACAAAADLGVWMINVHASGGRKMMEAARERLAVASHRPLLIAVTVLTSMGEGDIREVGYAGTPEENVLRLAALAHGAGLDGVVCSPREATALRAAEGADFLLVTPGVRPPTASADDQQRVMTPADAISAGADYLVVGRPVTKSPDPLGVLREISAQVVAASAGG
ncbi:MAG: orotidine-5'-phosphate decarboxylase [Gammaproteobacteria bacterium]|jgi:orotidine-5'-phosphate decarboxylase|nr:orotidine-5'-phosphate decarboxylase [Gammaproteobacteria bacterium]